MSGGDVFLDTSCLVALIRPNDALHEPARRVLQGLERERAPLVTSDWVLTEFLNAASIRPLRLRAAGLVDRLAADAAADIAPATRKGFTAALGLYRSRPDKDWSLVDCSSVLICQSRGIRRVFTHDRHFAQAGFEVLLP